MTLPMNQAVLNKYNVGPVKSWVQAAANYIGTKFNVKTIGGWRQSDPFPDHPSGHALDFMISSMSQGDAIAAEHIAHAQALGVKYLIWNRRTWNASRGTWAPYTSTSNPHTDHVHVTYNNTPGTGSGALSALLNINTGGGGLGAMAQQQADKPAPDTCAWNLAAPKIKADVPFLPDVQIGGQSFCLLSKVQVRVLFAIGINMVGIGIGLTGVILLVAYGLKASGVTGAVTDAASLFPGTGKLAKVASAIPKSGG